MAKRQKNMPVVFRLRAQAQRKASEAAGLNHYPDLNLSRPAKTQVPDLDIRIEHQKGG